MFCVALAEKDSSTKKRKKKMSPKSKVEDTFESVRKLSTQDGQANEQEIEEVIKSISTSVASLIILYISF